MAAHSFRKDALHEEKIAIVGSGISGLTAGFLLHKLHDITLFEAAPTLEATTATVEVEQAGRHYAIDTGFIVFNDRTYPNFLKLLERIGVGRQPAEMSFSVRSPEGWSNRPQPRYPVRPAPQSAEPRFYRFVAEILRFNREARAWLAAHRQRG